MQRVDVVTVAGWERFGWLRAGFSTRWGGVSRVFGDGETLNLGFGAKGGDPDGAVAVDADDAVAENRRRLLEAMGGGWELVVVRQVHGTEVLPVSRATMGEAMPEGRAAWSADGLMTAEAGFLLGAGAADCVPVLLADTRQRVVAAVHAGWRGTAAGMAAEAVRRMGEVFGTRAAECVAAVGPSIGACCYEVGDEVAEAFAGEVGVVRSAGARWRLDVWEANRRQLVRAGVEDVAVVRECTACGRMEDGRRRYFSHRAERGRAGRMLGMIGVR